MSAPGHRLRVSDETAELVRSLHPHLKRKVKAALQAILEDPQCGKALKDELAGLRSFRVGRLRIIYKPPSKKNLEVVAMGPRKVIYEETLRSLKKHDT
jgi:mRNA interferase RelE/StbE